MPITINKPFPGAPTLEFIGGGGQFQVLVQANVGGASEVHACIHFPGMGPTHPAPNAANPLAGFTELNPQGGQNFSKLVDCPQYHACATTPPQFDNLAVTVIYRETGTGLINAEFSVTTFKGVCSKSSVEVQATACPWFAYADEDLVGPRGEPVGSHKPTRIRIPDGASSVSLAALGSWRHEPTSAGTSDANGRVGQAFNLLDSRYMDAMYTYGQIAGPGFAVNVNTLVGLLEPVGSLGTTIFVVGNALTKTVSGMKALHLAMWDGYGWNGLTSNSGSQIVTLNWT